MRQWTEKTWFAVIVATLVAGAVTTLVIQRLGIRLQGLSNLAGFLISGGTLALITAIRSEQIRFQDVYMRRMDNTIKALDFYNDIVRPALLVFLAKFDAVISDDLYAHAQRRGTENRIAFRTLLLETAIQLELASVLHLLDKLGFLLSQTNYLNRQEVYHAIASETARLLLNPKYAEVSAIAGHQFTAQHFVAESITSGGHLTCKTHSNIQKPSNARWRNMKRCPTTRSTRFPCSWSTRCAPKTATPQFHN